MAIGDESSTTTGLSARRTIRRLSGTAPRVASDSRVVVLGQGADIHRALTHPAVESGRFAIVDAFDIDVEQGLNDANRRSVEQQFETFAADALLLAGPVGPSAATWATDVAMAHGIPLWALMPTELTEASDPRVVWPGSQPLLQLAGYEKSRLALTAKRAMDVLGALVGIALFAPVMLICALLIRAESKGWPLFRHTRVTKGGRRFGCLKLRTMYDDAEQHLEENEALYDEYVRNNYKIPEERDPRVTRVGRWLRRTSLDEVPQLWNVLVGDMSLVGPRPLVPAEFEHYAGARKRLLLSMRPGLTGAWAVSGRHGVSYPERAEIELSYVRTWRLQSDILVVLRTFRAILSY